MSRKQHSPEIARLLLESGDTRQVRPSSPPSGQEAGRDRRTPRAGRRGRMAAGERPPGWPGIEPRWTRGDKQAIGTAAGGGARVWFTITQGAVSEVYYPSPDRAN